MAVRRSTVDAPALAAHPVIVALAIVLACLALPLMPRKYLATAFVSPNLYSPEQGRLVALASVDATAIVNGEARLIVSDGALQAVVRRLDPKLLSEGEG